MGPTIQVYLQRPDVDDANNADYHNYRTKELYRQDTLEALFGAAYLIQDGIKRTIKGGWDQQTRA